MINAKQVKSLDKYYNISKILLTVTPFLYMMYISIGAAKIGASITQVIQDNPRNMVMFLISMINPFIAYLLIFMHRKMESGDIEYSVVNLAVLIVAEIILENVLYIILLGFLLVRTLKTHDISFKECFKVKWNKGFLATISGGIVVLALASICLFATIRIGT